MDNSRFLACLEADYRRMREVAGGHLGARGPTCPDWTVADLTRHVSQVYLHKVECMRTGDEVETDWPPAGLQDEEPVALLDRSSASSPRGIRRIRAERGTSPIRRSGSGSGGWRRKASFTGWTPSLRLGPSSPRCLTTWPSTAS